MTVAPQQLLIIIANDSLSLFSIDAEKQSAYYLNYYPTIERIK